jgi:hypothetical protein
VSETWATPDTIHDRSRTARARSEALRLVCGHPNIRTVLEEWERPRDMRPEEYATLPVDKRQALDSRVDRCREVLTQLDIPRWRWLLNDLLEILYGRLMPASLPDSATLAALARNHPDDPLTKVLLHWAAEQPDQLADARPWAAANLAREADSAASALLREGLLLTAPIREYVKGWSSSLAHEDVDRWAASAHQAIIDASGPPFPTSPGKRIGQVERWVGWWYRSQVLHDEISRISREEIGSSGATNNRAYVRKRIDEVLDLLSDEGGPGLPLRVARGNASRLTRFVEQAGRMLKEREES